MRNKIKNIVFDMGNVLLSYTPQDYIKTVTEDEVIAAAVLKELFYGSEWLDMDAGTLTEEQALSRINLRIPEYDQFVQKALDNWHTNLKPINGMPEIIKLLKNRGFKLYLLSNTSMRFFQYKDDVDMFKYFDGFLISAKEKKVKPHKEIFDCLCERFDLHSNECLFIDDLQDNIKGAQLAGFNTHLFKGSKELSEYLECAIF